MSNQRVSTFRRRYQRRLFTFQESKMKHLSPILFVKIKYLKGKKKNRRKTKMVKALVEC